MPVNGAGLSITDGLRLPLAASDEEAATVERLQITLGEGPCLTAVEANNNLVAATIAARWPAAGQAFLSQTTYQSVASLPLRAMGGVGTCALDLYSKDSQPLSYDAIDDIDLALATFRGYAFSHDITLDDVARELTNEQVEPDQLLV